MTSVRDAGVPVRLVREMRSGGLITGYGLRLGRSQRASGAHTLAVILRRSCPTSLPRPAGPPPAAQRRARDEQRRGSCALGSWRRQNTNSAGPPWPAPPASSFRPGTPGQRACSGERCLVRIGGPGVPGRIPAQGGHLVSRAALTTTPAVHEATRDTWARVWRRREQPLEREREKCIPSLDPAGTCNPSGLQAPAAPGLGRWARAHCSTAGAGPPSGVGCIARISTELARPSGQNLVGRLGRIRACVGCVGGRRLRASCEFARLSSITQPP